MATETMAKSMTTKKISSAARALARAEFRFHSSMNLPHSAEMKILMASSEMAPLARTGGLGDVLESLPAGLQKSGHEGSGGLPFYCGIRGKRALDIQSTRVRMTVEGGARRA